MSLLQTTVGERVAYGSARATCVAPCRGAGPQHGCSKLPRCSCTILERDAGPADPIEGQRKPQGRRLTTARQCRASLPHLSWQRRGEGRIFLGKRSWKSQKVKEEGKNGGQAVLPPSCAWKASHLQQQVVTWVLGLAAHFLFTRGGVEPMSCGFTCTLPLSHVGSGLGTPNPGHPSWPLEGGCRQCSWRLARRDVMPHCGW